MHLIDLNGGTVFDDNLIWMRLSIESAGQYITVLQSNGSVTRAGNGLNGQVYHLRIRVHAHKRAHK